MRHEFQLSVNDDGTVEYIRESNEFDFLNELGTARTTRASHVEPDNPFLRPLFHLLRWCFGEQGRVATFTRTWPCLWRVNMAPRGGPILEGRWRNRQQALDAEVAYLSEHL